MVGEEVDVADARGGGGGWGRGGGGRGREEGGEVVGELAGAGGFAGGREAGDDDELTGDGLVGQNGGGGGLGRGCVRPSARASQDRKDLWRKMSDWQAEVKSRKYSSNPLQARFRASQVSLVTYAHHLQLSPIASPPSLNYDRFTKTSRLIKAVPFIARYVNVQERRCKSWRVEGRSRLALSDSTRLYPRLVTHILITITRRCILERVGRQK